MRPFDRSSANRAGYLLARIARSSRANAFGTPRPKVVFSRTLTHLEWTNARVSDRPAEEEIPELKGEPGKDIVVFGGAGSLARSPPTG